MIKLIVFDLDDTLVDTGNFFIKSIRKAAAQVNLSVPQEAQVKAVLGLPFGPVLEGLWPGIDHEEVKNAYFDIELKNKCDCFPGVRELLTALKKEDYLLGILTSRTIKGVLRVMNDAGIKKEDFLFLETPDKQKYHKPDPRVFDQLLIDAKKKEVSKNEIIYIGDSLHDFGAAKGAGLQFIALVHGHTEKEKFVEAGLQPEFIAESVDELRVMINNVGKIGISND